MAIGDLNTPVLKRSGRPIGRMGWVEEISRKIGKTGNDLRQREMVTRDTMHRWRRIPWRNNRKNGLDKTITGWCNDGP